MTSVVGQHGKEFGVGVLAVISLFMVSMMVRKGAPASARWRRRRARGRRQRQTLNGNEAVVGNAAENNASLDGMELDEERRQGPADGRSGSADGEANPDSAANLVKRWLNR